MVWSNMSLRIFLNRNRSIRSVQRAGSAGVKIPKGEETDSRLEILLNKEEKEQIRREVMLPERIFAPVKKGELLGNIQYSLGDHKLGEYGLYADRDIEALTVPAAWKHIAGCFLFFKLFLQFSCIM